MAISAGPFGKIARRRTDAPSRQFARIMWIFLTLLRDEVIEYAACIDRFGISRREFQRDLHKLREVGADAGFTISNMRGGRVILQTSNRRIRKLGAKSRDVTATLARIARALGGPLEQEIQDAIGDSAIGYIPGFLHLREAAPREGSRVSATYAFMKEAAQTSARVEFAYTSARGARSTRRVEPYYVIARSGRYYLVAYDLMRRDWRQFALDVVAGPLRLDGTFAPRPVPERLIQEGAVGWIRRGTPTSVTIRVSPVVAAAVTSRQWQPTQHVKQLGDGGAEITLTYEDLGEAVRWALQFGAEAVIVAPPQAVDLARHTVDAIAAAYDVSPTVDVRKRAAG